MRVDILYLPMSNHQFEIRFTRLRLLGMRGVKSILTILLAGLIFPGGAGAKDVESCEQDLECLKQLHATHPAKYMQSWQAIQALPLERRIMRAPNRLIDYLNIDNRLQGFPNRTRPAKIPRKFLKDLKAAIAELPAEVIELVDDRLMGIFLVEDLGGTGATDYVFDDMGVAAGALIVLDVSVLNLPANRWATWKENTPFTPDAEFELRAEIETDSDNNLKQALQYILLHELGHVASVGANIHPPWSGWDCVEDPPEEYPYFNLSWVVSNLETCAVESRFDTSGFSYRKDVVYYFGARLPESVSPEVYSQLALTNFPSLYAATSPAEDFAEAFVTFVHQKMMNKPFEIRISRDGTEVTRFSGCWGEVRCAAKKNILSGLFMAEQTNP